LPFHDTSRTYSLGGKRTLAQLGVVNYGDYGMCEGSEEKNDTRNGTSIYLIEIIKMFLTDPGADLLYIHHS